MSLTRKDERSKAAELASWATPAQSQPELRKRLIGEQVRQARRSAGLTQLELARTLHIALSKLSRYEGGLDPISPSRLLLTRFVLGLAVGRRGLEGGVRSSPRPSWIARVAVRRHACFELGQRSRKLRAASSI
jgi:transcriptional regulator with XRE-family HTH domain